MSSKKLAGSEVSAIIGMAIATVAVAAFMSSIPNAFGATEENIEVEKKTQTVSLVNDDDYIKKTLKVYEPAIAKIEQKRAEEAEAARIEQEKAEAEAAAAEAEAAAAAADQSRQQVQQYDYTGYSYSSNGYQASPSYSNSGSFKSDGVWSDGNYRYTWYSSNNLYHYRTGEWSAGSDGIYRDSEGYVVVASSTHGQGSIIADTPFGAAKVYDSGCASGTLDVYTNY